MQTRGTGIGQVIAAGIAGTTGMTVFSYMLSEVKDKNFKEPLLLAGMISRLMPVSNNKKTDQAGWLIHYAVGILFAILYKYLLRKMRLSATVKNGSVTGGITGLIAIVIWHSTFRLHPYPPHTHRRKFYGQLVVAHIIFGMITLLLLGNKNKKGRQVKQSITQDQSPRNLKFS